MNYNTNNNNKSNRKKWAKQNKKTANNMMPSMPGMASNMTQSMPMPGPVFNNNPAFQPINQMYNNNQPSVMQPAVYNPSYNMQSDQSGISEYYSSNYMNSQPFTMVSNPYEIDMNHINTLTKNIISNSQPAAAPPPPPQQQQITEHNKSYNDDNDTDIKAAFAQYIKDNIEPNIVYDQNTSDNFTRDVDKNSINTSSKIAELDSGEKYIITDKITRINDENKIPSPIKKKNSVKFNPNTITRSMMEIANSDMINTTMFDQNDLITNEQINDVTKKEENKDSCNNSEIPELYYNNFENFHMSLDYVIKKLAKETCAEYSLPAVMYFILDESELDNFISEVYNYVLNKDITCLDGESLLKLLSDENNE
ncbi:MAG: hypothetical protein KDH96_12605, partial [Candidatus Riesia sp.]|nr:hypothetical protein [Candidatus Riesia sp.]